MGTRHIIAVHVDGEYKIAQYGQWDGYPSGQGADILKFLRARRKNYKKFIAQVRKCSWVTEDDIAKVNATPDWPTVFPHLSRDAGANILDMVYNAPDGLRLQDSLDFVADSLGCEYAYVIDFDKETFEVYKGFNKEPLAADERFAYFSGTVEQALRRDTYHPVRFITSFDLNSLPTSVKFISMLEPKDED